MYNVLKTKSSPSEEQSLSRQNDHANKLIRQIEGTIEHSEHARAKRFTLNDDGAWVLAAFIQTALHPLAEQYHGEGVFCSHIIPLTQFIVLFEGTKGLLFQCDAAARSFFFCIFFPISQHSL